MEIKINGNPGIKYLVNVIFKSTEGTMDPFYTEARKSLLTAVIGYVYYCLPQEEQSLNTVYELLCKESSLDEGHNFSFDFISTMKNEGDGCYLWDCFENYKILNEQTRQGIVTTTVCALASFLGPNIL